MTTTHPSPVRMTPAELDTTLAPIWERIQVLEASLASTLRSIEADPTHPRTNDRYTYADSLRGEIDALRAEARPFEAEVASRWAKNGAWNRYFLVKNANGHVHRWTDCSTCFADTQYAWLPSLSDCDEAEMVEEWGERACTVCFPNAPTLPAYHRPARIDREAQAARQAEAAARQAAKDSKAIVDVDGSPLKVEGVYGVIKTKVAARNELSGAVKSLAWYGPGHPTDFAAIARKLAAVLRVNAPDIDVDKVIANALKAVTKEGATHAAQVPALLAGETLTETIEDGVDTRLELPLKTLGAKVEVKDIVLHGRIYGQSLTVTFALNAIDASNLVKEASFDEPDTDTSVLLMELARRIRNQAR